MNEQRALEQYQNTQVETSSPARLVVLLYEGALRFIDEAWQAIERKDHPVKAQRINRAIHIVQELANALDHEAAPELSSRLAELYEYVGYELLQGSAFNDPSRLDNGRRVLVQLLDSWRRIADAEVETPATFSGDAAPPATDTADAPAPVPGASSMSLSA